MLSQLETKIPCTDEKINKLVFEFPPELLINSSANSLQFKKICRIRRLGRDDPKNF
jgi:hypothetical protein